MKFSIRASAVVLGIVLLAFGLRIWDLTFQSLWWDEGVSVYLSGVGISALTVTKDFAVDLHPPGYYLLLSGWRLLFGPSVFAVRLLSAFAGVLTIPLVVVLARWVDVPHPRASSPSETAKGKMGRTAAVVALIAAVSPLDVYYSQETRMYALLPVIALLSLLATTRALGRGTRRDWVVWAAANLGGWYVYYYLGLLTAAEALILLAIGWRRRQLRIWLLAQVGIVVGFVPWAAIAIRRMAHQSLALPPQTTTHPSPAQYLLENWQAFTLGFTPPPHAQLLLIIWAIAAVVGAVALSRRRPAVLALLLASLIVPLAGAGAVLLVRPFFFPRFVLFAIVPLWLLVTLGLASRGRLWPLGLAALVAIVAGSGWTWRVERTTPRVGYSSSDYLTVFTTLATAAQPGDVVICGYPWQAGYITAYLNPDDAQPVYAPGPVEPERVAALGGRAWVFDYGPGGRFGDDLAKLGPSGLHVLVEDQFGDARVALISSGPGEAKVASPLATLGDAIGLVGAHLAAAPILHPGDHVALTLRWQALAAPRENYTVFVHLLDPKNKVRGQDDSPPLKGAAPTRQWNAGELLVDRYDLTLAPDAPAGRYVIEVGMYLPTSGQRLRIGPVPQPDNRILIGAVQVER